MGVNLLLKFHIYTFQLHSNGLQRIEIITILIWINRDNLSIKKIQTISSCSKKTRIVLFKKNSMLLWAQFVVYIIVKYNQYSICKQKCDSTCESWLIKCYIDASSIKASNAAYYCSWNVHKVANCKLCVRFFSSTNKSWSFHRYY